MYGKSFPHLVLITNLDPANEILRRNYYSILYRYLYLDLAASAIPHFVEGPNATGGAALRRFSHDEF